MGLSGAGFSLWGSSPCMDQNPRAEACATSALSYTYSPLQNRGSGKNKARTAFFLTKPLKQDWFDDRRPHGVELRRWVQTVKLEQVAGQISIGIEHGRGDVDVLHALLRRGVVLHQLVCRFHLGPLVPA